MFCFFLSLNFFRYSKKTFAPRISVIVDIPLSGHVHGRVPLSGMLLGKVLLNILR